MAVLKKRLPPIKKSKKISKNFSKMLDKQAKV
jgi:hypothetical protein